MTTFRANLKDVWSRFTWPDLVSTALAAGGLMAAIFRFNGGFFSFLKYLAGLAGVYLLFRFIGWGGRRLLLSSRHRRVGAYFFVGFVPLLFEGNLFFLARRL